MKLSTPGTQQATPILSAIPQSGSFRGNLYQLPPEGNVNWSNPHESGGVHLNKVPSTGQQHYPSY